MQILYMISVYKATLPAARHSLPRGPLVVLELVIWRPPIVYWLVLYICKSYILADFTC